MQRFEHSPHAPVSGYHGKTAKLLSQRLGTTILVFQDHSLHHEWGYGGNMLVFLGSHPSGPTRTGPEIAGP